MAAITYYVDTTLTLSSNVNSPTLPNIVVLLSEALNLVSSVILTSVGIGYEISFTNPLEIWVDEQNVSVSTISQDVSVSISSPISLESSVQSLTVLAIQNVSLSLSSLSLTSSIEEVTTLAIKNVSVSLSSLSLTLDVQELSISAIQSVSISLNTSNLELTVQLVSLITDSVISQEIQSLISSVLSPSLEIGGAITVSISSPLSTVLEEQNVSITSDRNIEVSLSTLSLISSVNEVSVFSATNIEVSLNTLSLVSSLLSETIFTTGNVSLAIEFLNLISSITSTSLETNSLISISVISLSSSELGIVISGESIYAGTVLSLTGTTNSVTIDFEAGWTISLSSITLESGVLDVSLSIGQLTVSISEVLGLTSGIGGIVTVLADRFGKILAIKIREYTKQDIRISPYVRQNIRIKPYTQQGIKIR